MVSMFLEIAVGQTADTTRQFLQPTKSKSKPKAIKVRHSMLITTQMLSFVCFTHMKRLIHFMVASSPGVPSKFTTYKASDAVLSIGFTLLKETGWQLEEAIQLFYIGNEAGAASAPCIPPPENEAFIPDQVLVEAERKFGSVNVKEYDGSEVRAPLPDIRDVLYDSQDLTGSYISDEEEKSQGVWDADLGGSTSAAESSNKNLASFYRPPFALIFNGPFEKENPLLLITGTIKKRAWCWSCVGEIESEKKIEQEEVADSRLSSWRRRCSRLVHLFVANWGKSAHNWDVGHKPASESHIMRSQEKDMHTPLSVAAQEAGILARQLDTGLPGINPRDHIGIIQCLDCLFFHLCSVNISKKLEFRRVNLSAEIKVINDATNSKHEEEKEACKRSKF
ncbi:Thioredoxin-like fold [Artemisia annua]|uniref:Thioredoxin-like fold n=1 Tax=Artemisia annua TaxID=35608 RepID=A0A2U1MNK1_ARTAN|nr:Thioredoxin-like fold [Artemisia annua]